MRQEDSTVSPFNRDAEVNAGYLYTTGSCLSSKMANRRLSDATLMITSLCNKRVIDIGCGDGTYTIDLNSRGRPASILGVDPAEKAIEVARKKAPGRDIAFAVESAYKLPYKSDSFDVAHLRGVLHHMDRPVDALREALRVARLVVVIEPNGYNPVLKLLECASTYHREHEEKSYTASQLSRWICNVGGEITKQEWVGFVPFFCSDFVARCLKCMEPVVEGIPLFRNIGCAVCVMLIQKKR